MTSTQDVAHDVVWILAGAVYWTTHEALGASVQWGVFMAAEDEVDAAIRLAVHDAVSDPMTRAVCEAVYIDLLHPAITDFLVGAGAEAP